MGVECESPSGLFACLKHPLYACPPDSHAANAVGRVDTSSNQVRVSLCNSQDRKRFRGGRWSCMPFKHRNRSDCHLDRVHQGSPLGLVCNVCDSIVVGDTGFPLTPPFELEGRGSYYPMGPRCDQRKRTRTRRFGTSPDNPAHGARSCPSGQKVFPAASWKPCQPR
jgi:hypothetical protein